jgi:ABC-type Fe3+/spermidine/putrescine transport system ATPase subunit
MSGVPNLGGYRHARPVTTPNTLLRLIAGFEYPNAGSVFIGGRDVTNLAPRQRGFSMVFQSYALFPHLRVIDNLAFGLRMLAKQE